MALDGNCSGTGREPLCHMVHPGLFRQGLMFFAQALPFCHNIFVFPPLGLVALRFRPR